MCRACTESWRFPTLVLTFVEQKLPTETSPHSQSYFLWCLIDGLHKFQVKEGLENYVQYTTNHRAKNKSFSFISLFSYFSNTSGRQTHELTKTHLFRVKQTNKQTKKSQLSVSGVRKRSAGTEVGLGTVKSIKILFFKNDTASNSVALNCGKPPSMTPQCQDYKVRITMPSQIVLNNFFLIQKEKLF